ncbi:MAG: hypothetical protein K6B67_05345 [Lachnospiraceae bacterium]|nr:hypothetical protein [Lachnospiraceae bacterium]
MAKSKSSTQKPLFENLTDGLGFEPAKKTEPVEVKMKEAPRPEPIIKKEEPEKAAKAIEPAKKSSGFKIEKEEKETRSIRKQFLLTETQNHWIEQVAKDNDVSMNEVICKLIEQAMKL